MKTVNNECDVVKQHHTLTQILMGLLKAGFKLEAVGAAEGDDGYSGNGG